MAGNGVIVALVGPTASGKTEAAMRLADRHPVSLISLDSAMVYRGMDIGTAKPTPDELARYPHALIDIRDPAETYTVADFVQDADRCVQQALTAGRVPCLVGGSMLYLKAFREGMATLPAADRGLRASLAAEAERLGTPALHQRLVRLDPAAAAGIHPNNFSRIQRALEVHALTGETISSRWRATADVQMRLGVPLVELGIVPDSRTELHARIEARFDAMLARGFEAEVAALRARDDLHPDLPAMRAVGYRQVWEHLDGLVTRTVMREKALAATRQLAKRQLTWMRSWPQLVALTGFRSDEMTDEIVLKSGLNR